MGLKRSGRRTARIGNKHRCLHFHEALIVKITANGADDFGSLDEGILCFFIHNQIHISLTIADIGICKAVIFFRQNLQRLAKKGNLLGMNGNLAHHCTEYIAFDAHNITDIVFLEVRIGLFTDAVSGNIDLNVAGLILNITERSLAHNTLAHQTSGNAYMNRTGVHNRTLFLIVGFYGCLGIRLFHPFRVYSGTVTHEFFLQFLILRLGFGGMMGLVIFRDDKRILACGLKVCQFFTAHL